MGIEGKAKRYEHKTLKSEDPLFWVEREALGDFIEQVLGGELVFAHGVISKVEDYINRYSSGEIPLPNWASEETIHLLARTEITNMLGRARLLLSNGNFTMTKHWLEGVPVSLENYAQSGRLTTDDITSFQKEWGALEVQLEQASGS